MIGLRLTIIVILGSLPPVVHSFFLISPSNFTLTNNSIMCFTPNNQTESNGYQLCAIRIYTGSINSDALLSSSLYDGIWYTNTFRQLIKQCTGFSNTTDVGIGTCRPLPYEFYKNMTLCICAETLCNQNIQTCISSVAATSAVVKLPDVLPDLSNNTVTCLQTNNVSSTISTCSEHPFIFFSNCINYIQQNSVLCALNVDSNQITQEAWILQNYERYLMDDIYSLLSMFSSTVSFNETANNVYYAYMNGTTDMVQQCICTTPNYCNANISTCISQISVTANTADWTAVSTATNTTYAITGTLSNYSSTTTYTYPSTSPSITSSSSSTGALITSNSISFETTEVSLSFIVTPSANTAQLTPGESGLGAAASAGIACGIIFSALIIIAEIVIFKFFFSGGLASGNARAFTYRV